MKRQILICASLLFVLVASVSAKEFDPQKLLSSEKLIEAQTIVDRFEAGEKRIKVIANLAEPVPLRAMTNWKSEKSVRALRAEITNRQRPVMSSLRSDEFALRHRFENQAGYSGEVTFQGLTKLLDNPMVASVEPVRTMSLHLAQGIPLINALVPSRTDMYNGEGLAIAIVDTGVDYTHPRLGGGGFPNSKVIGGYDFGDNDPDPRTKPVPWYRLEYWWGHGTCCAGIAAGELGTVGDYIGGVAYGAKIYALKAVRSDGSMDDDYFISAWDWCLTHRNDDPAHPIMVVSNSWGIGSYTSPSSAEYDHYALNAAAQNLVAAGITVLASSGNEGQTNALAAPAAFSCVISVGAVYDVTSSVTEYSNTAYFLDVLAPAEDCYTTDDVGINGFAPGDYTNGSGIGYFGGTSAACPYAAGAVACLQTAAKAKTGSYLTPAQVRNLLTTYGDPVTDWRVAITKPRVNLGRAIDLINASLNVAAPNGGEVWVAGRDYDITWDSIGKLGNVKIELYKGGKFNKTVASSTANDGLFRWTIPSNQQTGSDYRVRISSTSYPAFYDVSNSTFTITVKSFIELNSPNGGESLLRGASHDITWDSTAAGSNVKIELYRGGQAVKNIVSSTSNNGSYSWYIDPNEPSFQTGTGYRVKITSTSTPSCYDYSKSYFSIIEPAITVTSPDGGEFLQYARLYNITWETVGGITDYVKIDLYKSDACDITITSSTPNNGSYPWSVPSGLAGGSDYSIRISDPCYYDFSDSYFSIGDVPWVKQTKLTASDGVANENFAYSVSIGAHDAIAGAYGDDEKGTDAGAAYMLMRSGESWIQQKILASDGAAYDYFGCSVAISGDYAIAGARGDDDKASSSGSAYIFKREGTNWIQQPKLTASDGAASDNFGSSVAIGGDYAIVGAYGDDDKASSSGSAYIFKRDGASWVQQAKLTASDGGRGDLFGYSVSISGDWAIVGAWGSGGGGIGRCAAYIFKRDGQRWVQQARLTAPEGSSGGDFGCSVSISGDWAIVGAYSDDGSVSGSGAAYVYRRKGASWIEQAKLIASDSAGDDEFGCSVSINGSYAVVGARWDSENGDQSGSAYVFRREGTNWAQQAKIIAQDGVAYDYLGYSVSVNGQGYAILGAWGDDDKGGSSGSAYVFTAMTVLTPNGGESWLRGTEHEITWNPRSSDVGDVKLELYKAGALVQQIVPLTENDGSYDWSIPTSLTAGSDYRIKITSASDSSCYDYSDVDFSISDHTNTTWYVDRSASGLKNGTSWANAFTELQSALVFALQGEEIWVAQGTYKPDYDVSTKTHTGQRTATFRLLSGVVVYGGFRSGGGQGRDPNIYQTVLSGDLAGNDVVVSDPRNLLGEPTRSENSFHVVTASGTDETAVLDGFIITAGRADLSYPSCEGGGMYNDGGSPTLTNCTFMGNCAGYLGGGMYNNAGGPVLTKCTFINNAAVEGGGMHNYNSDPLLAGCTFKRNFASEKGGEGAGLFACHNSSPRLTHCTFSDNSAELYGGGVFAFDNSNPILTNCTLSGNSAGRDGGGVYNYDGSLTLANCIIWGNTDSDGTVESSQFRGIPLLNYNCIQGWSGILGGTGNIGADPLFADQANGDYHLKSKGGRWDPDSRTWVYDDVNSPCIDAGDPNSDWSAEPRPNGRRINMGVYGGTPEASKSPIISNIADLNLDNSVDYADLMLFTSKWLREESSLPEDLNGDEIVNFLDFAIFADNWFLEK